MPRLQRKTFDEPEVVREFAHGRLITVSLDEAVLGHFDFEPGWRWSEAVRPIVGGDLCQHRHLGVCISGQLHVEHENGGHMDILPNDAYEIPPGHDAWVVGDEPWVSYEWASSRIFAKPPEEGVDDILGTLLFTDIVGSTATLERIGDAAWRDLLLLHNEVMREQIDLHRGRELDTTGDGFLAMFDGAGRAIRCARAMGSAARDLGLSIRAGCHTGEFVVSNGTARGIAVHAAARVMALAGADEIYVSSTTADLVAGVDLEEVGEFELKGITGPRRVFRVAAGYVPV